MPWWCQYKPLPACLWFGGLHFCSVSISSCVWGSKVPRVALNSISHQSVLTCTRWFFMRRPYPCFWILAAELRLGIDRFIHGLWVGSNGSIVCSHHQMEVRREKTNTNCTDLESGSPTPPKVWLLILSKPRSCLGSVGLYYTVTMCCTQQQKRAWSTIHRRSQPRLFRALRANPVEPAMQRSVGMQCGPASKHAVALIEFKDRAPKAST